MSRLAFWCSSASRCSGDSSTRGWAAAYRSGAAKTGGESAVWWLSYYANGKRVRKSSETENKRLAENILKEREGRVVTGQPILPRAHKVTFAELAEAYLHDYEVRDLRSLDTAKGRVAHLTAFFGPDKALAVTTDRIRAYQLHRKQAGATPTTINRETAALRRMFTLAITSGKSHGSPSSLGGLTRRIRARGSSR